MLRFSGRRPFKITGLVISLALTGAAISLSAYSQEAESKQSISKKLKAAEDRFSLNDFSNALPLFGDVYLSDSTDHFVAYKIGLCMYNLRKYKKRSLPYFETAAANGINEANYYLGNLYHLLDRFDESLAAFNRYSSYRGQKSWEDAEITRLKNIALTGKEMMRHPIDIKVENIGSSINSICPDYAPLITADESMLLFTSRRKGSTGDLLDPNGEYFEDIYVSYKKNGEWSQPAGIGPSINTGTHEATVALSASGDNLYLYRTNEQLTGGNIYLSKFNGKEWLTPEKLGSEINTEGGWESSASLSADGDVFYFSSNREGGFGGKDIYRIRKLPNGSWSKALNLGPAINTPYDEDFPFIHPDGKTLYFSSKAHRTMGGFDVFKTSVDASGQCSEPENLGYPINTTDDDICFVCSADGKTGYYSSAKADSYGETDIYTVSMQPEDARIPILRGSVITADDKKNPLGAKLTLIDNDTKKISGIYNSNPRNGNFILLLMADKSYKLFVEAAGYYPYTEEEFIIPITGEPEKTIQLIKKN